MPGGRDELSAGRVATAADLQEIDVRLSQLEQVLVRRRNDAQVWKGVAVGAILALAIAARVGSQGGAAIAAEERKVRAPFVVVDERGKTLLRVRKGESGGVLEVLRSNGNVQATLACGDDGGEFTVSGRTGTPVGELSSVNGGSLWLRYPNGQQAVRFGNHPTGAAMAMHDIHRTKVLAMGTSGIDNMTYLKVFNREGQEAVSLEETPVGGSIACFTETLQRDQPTHPVVRVEATPTGGKLTLFDRAGKSRTVSP